MSYDANIERSEFIMRDYDRRDYREDYDYRERDRSRRPVDPVERLAAVVNDPSIIIDPKMVKVINDPSLVMDHNGSVMKRIDQGMRPISAGRSPLLLAVKTKRTRRKTKTDRTMSSCLKQANARGKLKNGKFRKGWDQSRIMTYAHKLCRKEMGTKKGMVRKTARRAYKR